MKLPVLYLIDSIVKNVGKQYKTLFSVNIVNLFCGVFEKVRLLVLQDLITEITDFTTITIVIS